MLIADFQRLGREAGHQGNRSNFTEPGESVVSDSSIFTDRVMILQIDLLILQNRL